MPTYFKLIQPINPLNQASSRTIGQISKIDPTKTINAVGSIQSIREKRGYTYLIDYNNPNQINSIADVLTRTKEDKAPTGAITAAGYGVFRAGTAIAKIPGPYTKLAGTIVSAVGALTSVIAIAADKDFQKYIKDAYIDPTKAGDWQSAGFNALQGFSETADILAQPIKAFIPTAGGSGEKGIQNLIDSAAGALGVKPGSWDVQSKKINRTNYDYNTGVMPLDFALEMASDPTNFIDLAGFAAGAVVKTKVGPFAKKSSGKIKRRIKTTSKTIRERFLKSSYSNTWSKTYKRENKKGINYNFIGGADDTVGKYLTAYRAANQKTYEKKLKTWTRQSNKYDNAVAKINRAYDKMEQNLFNEHFAKIKKEYASFNASDDALKIITEQSTAYQEALSALRKSRATKLDALPKPPEKPLSPAESYYKDHPNYDHPFYKRPDEAERYSGSYTSNPPSTPISETTTSAGQTHELLGKTVFSNTLETVDPNYIEARAEAYTKLVENHYNPDLIKDLSGKFDALRSRKHVLEHMPKRIKNTKAWQEQYSRTKALIDKLNSQQRTNAAQTVDTGLLSKESVDKLSTMSLKPSDNKDLLKGVGGMTVKVLKSISITRDIANTIDRDIMKLATAGLPTLLWRGAKFVGRNLDIVTRLTISAALSEVMAASTAQFFKKYYTKTGFLDLGKFVKMYPNYTNHINKTKLYYSESIKKMDLFKTADVKAKEAYYALKIPDNIELATEINKSLDHIEHTINIKVLDITDPFSKDPSSNDYNNQLAQDIKTSLVEKLIQNISPEEVLPKHLQKALKRDLDGYLETLDDATLKEIIESYVKYIKKLAEVDPHSLEGFRFSELAAKLQRFISGTSEYTTRAAREVSEAIDTSEFIELLFKSVKEKYTVLKNTYNQLARELDSVVQANRVFSPDVIENRPLPKAVVFEKISAIKNALEPLRNTYSQFNSYVPDYISKITKTELSENLNRTALVFKMIKSLTREYNELQDRLINSKTIEVTYGLLRQYALATKNVLEELSYDVKMHREVTTALEVLRQQNGALAKSIEKERLLEGSVFQRIQQHLDNLDINKIAVLEKETPTGTIKMEVPVNKLFTDSSSLLYKPIFNRATTGDFDAFKQSYADAAGALREFLGQAGTSEKWALKTWIDNLSNVPITEVVESAKKQKLTKLEKTLRENRAGMYKLDSPIEAKIRVFDNDLFNSLYEMAETFGDVANIRQEDSTNIAAMLRHLDALEELINYLPSELTGNAAALQNLFDALREAVTTLKNNTVEITKSINILPDRKAYQLYYSSTKSYLSFTTDQEVSSLMASILRPAADATDPLSALLKAMYRTNGHYRFNWLEDNSIKGFIEEGSDKIVYDALQKLVGVARDYELQQTLVNSVWSDAIYDLTNYAETDLRRDELRILIIDSLKNLNKVSGSDFFENFEEHTKTFYDHLYDNLKIRSVEGVYNLEYLKENYLKDELKETAQQFKNHDAASDVNITELVIKQYNQNKDPKDWLFEQKPDTPYVILDTEFSVNTQLSKNTYQPLQLAYKLLDAPETTNFHIQVSREMVDTMDYRTFSFFEKAKHADEPNYIKKTLEESKQEFIQDWCVPKNPTRAYAFYNFFKDLRFLENTSGHPVYLIAHNGVMAEWPLLQVEFENLIPTFIQTGVFTSVEEAHIWFTELLNNAIDTLAQLHSKENLPSITPAQMSALQTLLSEYAAASKEAKYIMRPLNASILDSLNALLESIKDVYKKSNWSNETAEEHKAFVEYLIDTKNSIRNKLSTYSNKYMKDVYFDDQLFKEYRISIDGKTIPNFTKLNEALGTVNYYGSRRISTPNLRHFFDDRIFDKTLRDTRYINLADEFFRQVDNIRYPSHIIPHIDELKNMFVALKDSAKSLSDKTLYNSYIQYFEYLYLPENPKELFVVVRKMRNDLKKYTTKALHDQDLYKQLLPQASAKLQVLFDDYSPIYTNRVSKDFFDPKPVTQNANALESSFEKYVTDTGEKLTRYSADYATELPFIERLQTYRSTVTNCCKNETERLREISRYFEDMLHTGYSKPVRSDIMRINQKILPIANKFNERPLKELLQDAEVFYRIPTIQIANRFDDFTKEKADKFYRELLYNPLHLAIIDRSDLRNYKELVAAFKTWSIPIKCTVTENTIYFHLTKDTLNKYSFNNGVPYLKNKQVDPVVYPDIVGQQVAAVNEIKQEVTTLYTLPDDYFSDSCGRVLSEETLRKIYEQIPASVKNQLPDIEMLLKPDALNRGPIINNILLGNHSMRYQFSGHAVQDPIADFVKVAQDSAADTNLRMQWLHYFFDASEGLVLAMDEQGQLLDNVLLKDTSFQSIADLCAALEVNKTYTLAALVPAGDKIRVFELPVNNPRVVQYVLETRKVPIKLMTHAEARTIKHIIERPKSNPLTKAWKWLIRVFKNAVLVWPGTFFRNALDTTAKTLIDMGIADTTTYMHTARKLRREYDEVIKLATSMSFTSINKATFKIESTSGLLNEKALDYVFGNEALLRKHNITIDKEQFEFIRAFKESDAAGAMNKIQEAQKRYRKAFLNSAEHKADPALTFNDWLKQKSTLKAKLKKGEGFVGKLQGVGDYLWGEYNQLISLCMSPTSFVEDVNRLAMYLKYSDEGLLTKTEIFQKIKDVHFNFEYKTDLVSKIENFIPFFNFTKENAVYWLHILEERPDVTRVLTNLMTAMLDMDSYDVRELEYNRSLVNAITNGYLRLDKETNLMLKTSPSFLNAFALFTNPVDAFQQGFIIDTPQSREALMQWEGGWKEALEQNRFNIPWIGTIPQRINLAKRNLERLDRIYANSSSPELRQRLNRAAATISSVFAVPTSYRTAKYNTTQYYKRWRNYRSPTYAVYTRTGVARMDLLMQPTTPENLKYKMAIMQSYTNRQ